MPVFDTAAAVRGSIGRNTYLEGKALRADTDYKQAATDLTNKQVETYDQKLAMDQQDSDTKFATQLLALKKFKAEGKEDDVDALSNYAASFLQAREDGKSDEEANAIALDELEIVRPGAIEAMGGAAMTPDLAKAMVMTPEEWRMRGRGEESVPSDYTLGGKYRYSGKTNEIVAQAPDDGSGENSRFAKPSVKDFTPESIAKFNTTGDESDLVPRPESTKPSIRDQKIAALRALNTPEEKIVDLVDGYMEVTSSTDSMGNVTVTNTRTGEASKVSARVARAANLIIPEPEDDIEKTDTYTGPAWAKPVALISPAPNLQNTVITESQTKIKEADKALQAAALVGGEDMMDAAGVANIAGRGLNNVLQLISFNSLPRYFQEETDARLKVLNFNQAVRSAVVISSKGNVWEQQMVEKFLPNPDNILSDPVGEGIAFTRTLHWLMNQRETDVAFLEGRAPKQISRIPLGVEDDPIIVKSQEEAEEHPPGTWVQLNGRIGEVN
jgi:hypothetical protein